MRINVAIPEEHVKKPVLDAALEAVTRLNEELIKSGDSPTADQLIAQGARWQPEPPGQEHFDHGALIAERGFGDCDDWAPLKAAQLRVTGEDPDAVAEVRRSGENRWHAVVIRGDGTEDDPSLDAGMPSPGRRQGVHGAVLPIMFPARPGNGVNGEVGTFVASPQLALRPLLDRAGQVESWQARADLPWHWLPGKSPTDIAMSSLHQSPVSDQAIVGAVMGAWELGLANGEANPEHLRRLAAIADACNGYPWEELVERYGQEHATAAGAVVGSFFGKAFKGLKKLGKGALKLAAPIAKAGLSFVPGGSLASSALSMASPLLKKHVAKGKHLPPAQRALALQQGPAPQFGGGGGPQFLPYPYPLPYPVPGWGGGASSYTPGTAWPPRGA